MTATPDSDSELEIDNDEPSACVMVFNANDPSGASGISADIQAIASVGAHALPVIAGTYARDTAEVYEHYCMDDEAVTEQARAILEDVPVLVFKVGFVGSPENSALWRNWLRTTPIFHSWPICLTCPGWKFCCNRRKLWPRNSNKGEPSRRMR